MLTLSLLSLALLAETPGQVTAEVFTGELTSVTIALVGYGLASAPPANESPEGPGVGIVLAPLWLVAVPLSIWGAGRLAGGHGSYLATLGGVFLGVLFAGALTRLGPPGELAAALIPPLTGALAFAATDHGPTAPPKVSLAPWFSGERRGLALAVRF